MIPNHSLTVLNIISNVLLTLCVSYPIMTPARLEMCRRSSIAFDNSVQWLEQPELLPEACRSQ